MAEDEGVTFTIPIIFGLIAIIFTVLLISAGIIFVSDKDEKLAKSISQQLSYISSLDHGDNTLISINLPNKNVNVQTISENKVSVIVEDSNSYDKDFLGDRTIKSNPGNKIVIS